MRRGNSKVWGALANNRKAFEAHSDTCEWPNGCANAARWYYTSISGRWSVCDEHCPAEFRTDPIRSRQGEAR
jgi:hypothetical protein